MRTSAISLITGTDRRRKQTLSVVLSCKLPFDMWLLPDNPSSQHIHVCVCMPSCTMIALFSLPWQQAMTSLSSTCRTQVIESNWFITQPKGFFFLGGGGVVLFSCLFLSLKRVRLGVRLSHAKAWKTAASLMNNLGTKVRGITPLLRFPTKPQLSVLWSPLSNHCTEQRFEFLDLWLIFCILFLIFYQCCYYVLLNL